MSQQIKGHSTMGLPRASGKRRWSGEEGEEALPAAKVICTSPPHALCAEDVLHHPALTHAHANTPAIECELTSSAAGDPSTTSLEQEDLPPGVPGSAPPCLPGHHTFTEESDDDDSDDDHDDFIDDEEDKDSGFIDSNSIDNSSDDEVENRVISGDAGDSCSSSTSSSSTTTTSTTTASTSLQLSLSKVLPPASTSPPATPSAAPSLTMSQVPSPPLPLTVYTPTLSSLVTCTTIPTATTNTSPSAPVVVQAPLSPGNTTTSTSPPPPFSPIPSIPTTTFLLSSVSTITTTCTTTTTATTTTGSTTDEPGPKTLPGEGSITTVTATQTGTVVTSTYQGALTSPVYEPHPFTYTGEAYPARPSTPTWESCNYYDGSQPTTNKYMEISPNNKYMEISSNKPTTSSQSIQCDENGKSYLELGSASPYTHTYSSECGNYTTSPSTYPPQSYNQTYTSPSTYGQPNSYYGPRQSYSPGPYVYPAGENYATFEGENGCTYSYGGTGYGGVRGSLVPSRGPPRCMSPYCDPTRGSPRPSCYHQQRLSVLNMSMYKLNRFRQFPDPSLHRSVLICNTLRHIERELEAEGVSVASLLAHSHGHPAHPHLQGATLGPGSPPCPEPMPSSSPPPPAATETPLSPMHTPLVGSPLAAPSSPPPSTPGSPPPATHYTTPVYPAPQYLPADHASGSYDNRETVHMRAYPDLVDNTSHEESPEEPSSVTIETTEEESSPTTPPPRPAALPPEERADAINWCSVLSLSSQTDLDSMNNNEYGEWSNETAGDLDYSRPEDGPPWKLPSLSAEDVLKSFPEASKRLEANEDLDSIINVLVGS